MQLQWGTVRYMLADCQYGGRITDDLDRVLMATYADVYFNQKVLETGYTMYPGYSVPSGQGDADVDFWRAAIPQLPDSDTPELFGMHVNASITFCNKQTNELLNTIIDTQPKTGNSRRIEQLSTTLKLLQDGVAEIFVRTIFDTTITVAIDGMLTTDDLLTRIGERMSLSLWYGLVFAGRHIEAGRSLMDYNIQNRSIIQQTHQLPGGTRDGVEAEKRSMLRVAVSARDGSARSQTPPRRTGATLWAVARLSTEQHSEPPALATGSHRSTTPPRSISQKEARGTPPAEDEEPVDVLVQTVSVDEESDSEDKGQYLLVAKGSGGDDEKQVPGKAS